MSTRKDLLNALDDAYEPSKGTSLDASIKENAKQYQASSKLQGVKRTISEDLESIRKMSDTPEDYLQEVAPKEREVQKMLEELIEKESEAKALADEIDKLESETLPEQLKEAHALRKEITDELEKTEKQLKDADCKNDPAYCEKLRGRIDRLNTMQTEADHNIGILEQQFAKIQELREQTDTIAKAISDSVQSFGRTEEGSNEEVRQQFSQSLDKVKEGLTELSTTVNAALSKAGDLFKGIISSITNVISSMRGLKTELAAMKNDRIEPTPGLNASPS